MPCGCAAGLWSGQGESEKHAADAMYRETRREGVSCQRAVPGLGYSMRQALGERLTQDAGDLRAEMPDWMAGR